MVRLIAFSLALCLSCGVYCQTNIFDASRNGDTASLKAMITLRGDTVNSINASGHSPLIVAAYNNQVALCKLLLEHGAEVNYTFSQGAAIHGAAFKGNIDIVKLLVANDAAFDSPDQNGSTPLIYATLFKHNEVAEFLFQKGANPYHEDGTGTSAIEYAKKLDNLDLLTLFKTKTK